MENNNEADVNRWTNDRLAALSLDNEWHPNLSRGFERLQQRLDRRPGRRRVWVVAGVIAAGLPLMAFPVTRTVAQRCVSACVTFMSASAPSSTYVKPEDRKLAPDFTVTDSSGRPVKLSDFRGKTVLLNFWATWCGPCKVEIPWFKGLQQTYRDRDFTVLGVSLEEGGWNSVKPYMDSAKFNYPVLVGSDDIALLYGGLDAVPTTFLIDKTGRIAAIHVGLCSKNEYVADINAVLKEQ